MEVNYRKVYGIELLNAFEQLIKGKKILPK
jgi:hypothetical protein